MLMPLQAQAPASLMKMTSLEITCQEKKQESEIDTYQVHPLEILHSFPNIKMLSLKVKIGLPAFAACEIWRTKADKSKNE